MDGPFGRNSLLVWFDVNSKIRVVQKKGEKGTKCTALQGNLKWQKNIRWISRVPLERPHLELRKEPPLDGLEKPLPNPLMASLLQRLAIKGFWVWLLQTIMWGLFSKLYMRAFSWYPRNPSDIFLPFQVALKCGARPSSGAYFEALLRWGCSYGALEIHRIFFSISICSRV